MVCTHAAADPYNGDHAIAHAIALRARVLAQAPGVEGPGGGHRRAAGVLLEPHQPEQCGFKPDVLLDITPVWGRKVRRWDVGRAEPLVYVLHRPRPPPRHPGRPHSGPNLGLAEDVYAEAYQRGFHR